MGRPPFSRIKSCLAKSTLKDAEPIPSTSSSLTSDAPYVPAVGDVVEFERNGQMVRGVLFLNYGNNLGIIYPNPGDSLDLGWLRLDSYPNAKKIGFSPMMLESYGDSDNGSITSCKQRIKAYFSAPYVPSVGDLVAFEYRKRSWTGICLNCETRIVLSVDPNEDSGDKAWAYLEEISNARFINHLDDIPTKKIGWCEASKVAKAYFALEPVK